MKRKPLVRDRFGKDFDTWPIGSWKSPRRTWLLILYRCDSGRDYQRYTKLVYHEVKTRVKEKLAAKNEFGEDIYYSCILKEVDR